MKCSKQMRLMVNECCVNVPDSIKYNPEDSLLRRNQKELLVILKDLAEICDRHGICWWLSSGTLLGAARHRGFIPWDDDIDIVMPRKEFKKLRKILMEEENDKYFLQCNSGTKHTMFHVLHLYMLPYTFLLSICKVEPYRFHSAPVLKPSIVPEPYQPAAP